MITRITVSGGNYIRVTVGSGGGSNGYSNPAYPLLNTKTKALDYLLGTFEYVLFELSGENILEGSMYLSTE